MKGGLKHKKRQDIPKITRRHNHLQKIKMFNTWILRKTVGLKKNIKNHGLIFHYNIRYDDMLGIGYVDVRCIPCIC